MKAAAGLSSEISHVMPALTIFTTTKSWIASITVSLRSRQLVDQPPPQPADALGDERLEDLDALLDGVHRGLADALATIRVRMLVHVRPRIDRISLMMPLRSNVSGISMPGRWPAPEQPALQALLEVVDDLARRIRARRP